MKSRLMKIVAGLAAVAALALGGVALAGGSGEPEQSLKGPEAEKATAAALKITGGGKANAVERDSEKGATYEVEVTRPDGSTVDVRLDASYALVAIDGDSESEDESGSEQGEQ